MPRLVADLACSVDQTGSVYLDNVDVGGVVIADGEEPFFIAAILNSPAANFVFRRISKPFRGSYLSANKQFIAPLPIPPASDEERTAVASNAKLLQVPTPRAGIRSQRSRVASRPLARATSRKRGCSPA
ncbi:MAG: hypothetical protein DLM68_16095 [Hyphomicrobiales bacterium]|nr:MAG: hypothetical protein DLM68_16095 [Hyphomicrobiales bacterium]